MLSGLLLVKFRSFISLKVSIDKATPIDKATLILV